MLLWIIATVMAITTAWTEREIAWLFVLAGLVAVAVVVPWCNSRPSATSITPVLFAVAAPSAATQAASLPTIFWFFVKAGAFVFGSGLAIVPFLYGEVVQTNHWLTDRQFLDAVAVAMITPGPVVITVAFIGYIAQGFSGAVLASLGVFLPCYLFVVIPAPYYARFANNPQLKAFVDGITAAATGAIAGAVFVLARRAIVDGSTLLVFATTLACLIYFKRIPEPLIIAVVGILTVLLR